MLAHNYSIRLMLYVKDLINAPLGLLPPTTSSGNRASQTSSHGSCLFYKAIFAGAATTCAGHEDKGLGFGGMRVEAWLGRKPSTWFLRQDLGFACMLRRSLS